MSEKRNIFKVSFKLVLLVVAFFTLLLHICYGELLGVWQNYFLAALIAILVFIVIYPSTRKWSRDKFLLYFIIAYEGMYLLALLHYIIIHYHLLLGQPWLNALIFYCFDFFTLFFAILSILSFFKLYYSGEKFSRRLFFYIIIFVSVISYIYDSFTFLAILAFFHGIRLPWMRETSHNLRKVLLISLTAFWVAFFWLPSSIFFQPYIKGLQPLMLGGNYYNLLIKLFFIYIILITIRMGISLVETSRGIRSKSVLSYVFTGLIPLLILIGVIAFNFILQALYVKYYFLSSEYFTRLKAYNQRTLESNELIKTINGLNSYINKSIPLSDLCQKSQIGLKADFPQVFQTIQVRPIKGGKYILGYSSDTPDIFRKASPLPNWFEDEDTVDFYKEKGSNFIKAIAHDTIEDWQVILQIYIPINQDLINHVEEKFDISIELAEEGKQYTFGEIIRTLKNLPINVVNWQNGRDSYYANIKLYNSWGDIFNFSAENIIFESVDFSPQTFSAIVAIVSISIALSFIIISTFIGWRINKGMRRSLDALVEGMKRIGEGDLDYKINLQSFDEYYRLANSINNMTNDLRSYIKDTFEKQKMEQELKTATLIQQSMLPEQDPILEDFEISSYARPAKQMGGDYYDYLHLSKKRLGVVMGDVSGHGVPAGLLMSMAKSSLYNQIKTSYKVPDVLYAMNNMVYEVMRRRLLMTFCYSILNLDRRKLSFSSAGHHFPYLYSSKKQELFSLESIAYPLGVRKDVHYKEKTINLRPGDMILFYTDGIIETRNEAEEDFGFDRLEDLLRKNWYLPAKDIQENIINAVDNFTGQNPQFDDITFIVIKVKE